MNNESKPMKFAIYARVSASASDKELLDQLELAGTAFARSKEWKNRISGSKVVMKVSSPNISSNNEQEILNKCWFDRTDLSSNELLVQKSALADLIEQIKLGNINTIVVDALQRFSDSNDEFWRDFFEEYRINVICLR